MRENFWFGTNFGQGQIVEIFPRETKKVGPTCSKPMFCTLSPRKYRVATDVGYIKTKGESAPLHVYTSDVVLRYRYNPSWRE